MLDMAAMILAAHLAADAVVAKALAPDPEMTVTEWADGKRRLAVESSPRPGQWSTDVTPYLREIMDCLSPSHPCWKVTVKKGAQLGFTDAGINWMGMIADVAAGPMGVFQPTIDMCSNFIKTKLDPAVDATPALRGKVAEQKSRDGTGSTTRFKRFPGGFWVLSGANSSAGLQMFSFRYLFKDELSEWPEDAGGRGDPSDQADTRTDAFEATRKIYQPSTPGIKGVCRITVQYEESDQRRYYAPCPHCGAMQVLSWKRVETTDDGLTVYRCAGCEDVIHHHHKVSMLKDATAGGAARWIKCYPDPETGESPLDVLSDDEVEAWSARDSGGRQPGFWINQLYSPFKSWAAMVEDARKSSGSVLKEKVFHQQGLGLEWEETGEAPEVDLLMLRREEYPLGRIPPGGLVLTCGVDVQKNYLQYEVVAWGVGMTSWGVDFGVIEGDTADEAAWEALADLLEHKRFVDHVGNGWPIEMAAVDAGYNTQWVYNFCRHRPLAMAVKGAPGPMAPLVGTPQAQEVSWRGKKIARGVMLWPVGDWQLKAELYANLRKPGPKDGAETFPSAYCHFSTGHDKGFFEQLTAEHLVSNIVRGRERKEWVLPVGKKNEALDCRKYARAAAEHLGFGRLDEDGWRRLAAQRGLSADPQMDMAALWTGAAPTMDQPTPDPTSKEADPAEPAPTGESDWVGKTRDGWI